jgi:hypothetical protein
MSFGDTDYLYCKYPTLCKNCKRVFLAKTRTTEYCYEPWCLADRKNKAKRAKNGSKRVHKECP